jgi:hypothetical protein
MSLISYSRTIWDCIPKNTQFFINEHAIDQLRDRATPFIADIIDRLSGVDQDIPHCLNTTDPESEFTQKLTKSLNSYSESNLLHLEDNRTTEKSAKLRLEAKAMLETMPRYRNLRAWILALRSDNTLGVEQLRISKSEIRKKLQHFLLSGSSVSILLEQLDPAHKRPVLTHTSRKLKEEEAIVALEYTEQQACDLAIGKCWISLPLWITGTFDDDEENVFQSSLGLNYGKAQITAFEDCDLQRSLQSQSSSIENDGLNGKIISDFSSRLTSHSSNVPAEFPISTPDAIKQVKPLDLSYILGQLLLIWTCDQTEIGKAISSNGKEASDHQNLTTPLLIKDSKSLKIGEELEFRSAVSQVASQTSINDRRLAEIKWYESTIEQTQEELTKLLLRKSRLMKSVANATSEQDEEELRHVLNTEEAVLQGRLKMVGTERRDLDSGLNISKWTRSSPAELPDSSSQLEFPDQNCDFPKQFNFPLRSSSTSTYESGGDLEATEIAKASPKLLEPPWNASSFSHFSESNGSRIANVFDSSRVKYVDEDLYTIPISTLVLEGCQENNMFPQQASNPSSQGFTLNHANTANNCQQNLPEKVHVIKMKPPADAIDEINGSVA